MKLIKKAKDIKTKKFYFVLESNMNKSSWFLHDDYKYKFGVNEGKTFNFFKRKYIPLMINKETDLIATITLDSEEIVDCRDIIKNIYTSNKINIESISKIEDFYDEEELLEIVTIPINISPLCWIKNKTYELCMKSVKYNPFALQYIDNPSYDLCKEAVTSSGYAIRVVKEQTNELCKLPVKKNGRALEYINDEKQNEDICLEAIRQDIRALQFVKNITDNIKNEINKIMKDEEREFVENILKN
jgi:hypothetical protein